MIAVDYAFMPKKGTDTFRVHVTLPNAMNEKIEYVKEITGYVDKPELARYLIGRGLEAMNAQIMSARFMKRMEDQYSPQEMLPILEEIERNQPKT